MPVPEFIESGATALLWAAIFLWGVNARSLFSRLGDRRAVTSFGAGMAIAYVFMHMMPELHEVRRTFAASVPIPLFYEGKVVYFVALVGFMVFYSLRYLRMPPGATALKDRAAPAFWLHVSGFAAYVCLLGYLLVNSLQETETSIALYGLAIAFHFLAVDRALHDEHDVAYQRAGRFLIAAASIIGWGGGMLFALPQHVVTLLVAFLSGAIIMNSTVMELRTATDGRFWPMMAGGGLYGLVLLVTG
jgi:hypothetical protein